MNQSFRHPKPVAASGSAGAQATQVALARISGGAPGPSRRTGGMTTFMNRDSTNALYLAGTPLKSLVMVGKIAPQTVSAPRDTSSYL